MDTAFLLEQLKELPFYQNQIVHVEHIPSQSASYGELDKPLPPLLESALKSAGMFPLYTHQVTALKVARAGRNVMVSTSAASGKTMCYNLPILEALLNDKNCCALYLFPTKALAQDQMQTLLRLSSHLHYIECALFDGDTPQAERAGIRRRSRVVLSNPDMLHLGILPNHSMWSRFLRCLRFVVVDEAHMYRGVFGSQVGNVLRRLRRLCGYYNSFPQFICCSATIANPKEHIEKLVGLPFDLIEENGSSYGGKDFVFWNPPLIDEAHMVRRSTNSEAASLLAELVHRNIRTLTFAHTRKLTELIYRYSHERLVDLGLAEQIKPYRAGYLPEERRQIERDFFQGNLRGIVATTALELGIDIGDLDATILTGYPGSIASTWQQAGRSGRKQQRSLSILIGASNPLDQYFMHHPDSFFHKGFENALINPGNIHILKSHLLCAAWELPLVGTDKEFFGESFTQVLETLEQSGQLRMRKGRWYPSPTINYPAAAINLRSVSDYRYTLVDSSQRNKLMETVEGSIALLQLHPGAIYLHQGETFLVVELDLHSHTAYAQHVDVSYYTQARELSELRIISVIQEKEMAQSRIYLGEVEVTTTVIGFKKKMQYTEEVIEEEVVELPPYSFQTVAVWFDIPPEVKQVIYDAGLDFAGGLHATEHATIAMLPLFALCDRNDIGGISTLLHPDTGKPQIFIYDAHPGGIGIAEKGFELIQQLWEVTQKMIVDCPCEEGCPSCIHSPKCGNNNQPLDKEAAVMLMDELCHPLHL